MIIKREQLVAIGDTIAAIKNKAVESPISIRYKVLKLESLLVEELTITQSLLTELCQRYAEFDESGQVITDGNNGIKLKPDQAQEAYKEFNDFYSQNITIPDYYFTLDELEIFELDWNALSALMPLIQE